MSNKRKQHGCAERLKYMHMLENGLSANYIETHYGINHKLLCYVWSRYQSEDLSELLKKQNIKVDYTFKVKTVLNIEEKVLG